jgi:hypothetical protein
LIWVILLLLLFLIDLGYSMGHEQHILKILGTRKGVDEGIILSKKDANESKH